MERTRQFFDNRFVYAVISQRAHGLSIGINMNPDKVCSFDCIYCEVNRAVPGRERRVALEVLSTELRSMLTLAVEGRVRELPGYHWLPEELLQLKEVALSGDGEPTLSPQFEEVVGEVAHVRAQGGFPFFKIVLTTNSTGLHLPQVQAGLKLFTARDEIWAKLDAGTDGYLAEINQPQAALPGGSELSLDEILGNILALGRQRPVVIQSLFALVGGKEPPVAEIEAYTQRLRELKEGGAQISLVQIYSAHRPAMHSECRHLPLRALSQIAQRVRETTGLEAVVF